MITGKHLVAFTLAASSTAPLFAAEQTPVQRTLEEIVVTSSRVPVPLRQLTTSVSIVTRTDIERLGYNSLYNVLRTQPGIGVSNQGGPGSVTSLRIRGEENYRTRFYIDGIDISDTSSPQPTTRIEHVMSAGIERVEILRGPQGLMYGADAGGIVNISTIAPSEGFNGSLSAEGGRYGTQQYAGNINGGNGTFDFSLSASDFESDLFNARTTDTDLRDDDGYDNTTLHARLGWNVTERVRLSFAGRDIEADTDYDGCFTVDDFSPSNACTDEFEQQSWRVAANYTGEQFGHEVFYTDNDSERENFTEGQFSFGLSGDVERGGYLGSYDGGDALKFAYGVDLLTESVDDSGLDDRDQESVFAEYQGGFDDSLYVTAGARYDDNEEFGSTTTYRLGGAYLLPLAGGEMKLRASWGTGVRFPALNEIGLNNTAFVPAPDLAEEETEGYDVGISWTDGAKLRLEATYFDQQITDEIFFDNTDFVYLQRSGDTESQGVEFAVQWDVLANLTVDGNYTYTDSRDINGDQRARRPEQMANVGLNWATLGDRLLLGLQGRLSYDAIDIDGTDLDDYEVLDINATYFITDGLQMFGRVENVTDEDYEQVPTYNAAGAAGYLGLRYSF